MHLNPKFAVVFALLLATSTLTKAKREKEQNIPTYNPLGRYPPGYNPGYPGNAPASSSNPNYRPGTAAGPAAGNVHHGTPYRPTRPGGFGGGNRNGGFRGNQQTNVGNKLPSYPTRPNFPNDYPFGGYPNRYNHGGYPDYAPVPSSNTMYRPGTATGTNRRFPPNQQTNVGNQRSSYPTQQNIPNYYLCGGYPPVYNPGCYGDAPGGGSYFPPGGSPPISNPIYSNPAALPPGETTNYPKKPTSSGPGLRKELFDAVVEGFRKLKETHTQVKQVPVAAAPSSGDDKDRIINNIVINTNPTAPASQPQPAGVPPVVQPQPAVLPTVVQPQPGVSPINTNPADPASQPQPAGVPPVVQPQPAGVPTVVQPQPGVSPINTNPAAPASQPQPAGVPPVVQPQPAGVPTVVQPQPAGVPTVVQPQPGVSPVAQPGSDIGRVSLAPMLPVPNTNGTEGAPPLAPFAPGTPNTQPQAAPQEQGPPPGAPQI